MKEYETWVDNTEDGEETTMCEKNNPNKMLSENAKLIASYKAASYDEAMQKHYDVMGWGVYKPF